MPTADDELAASLNERWSATKKKREKKREENKCRIIARKLAAKFQDLTTFPQIWYWLTSFPPSFF